MKKNAPIKKPLRLSTETIRALREVKTGQLDDVVGASGKMACTISYSNCGCTE